MRILCVALLVLVTEVQGQTDWPVFGHDPGGMRYSPLKQINTKNVSQLKLAWSFDTPAPMPQFAAAAANVPIAQDGAPSRRPRGRRGESTPLVIGNVMYMSTAYNRVLAMEPETGKKIWEYESAHTPAMRGIAYWPGNQDLPPQILFGTLDGWLISLNAKTGKPVPGFGREGMVNLKEGVADKYPNQQYGMTSPPALYKDLLITGSNTGERPSFGASGDIRAWDVKTGKMVWRFHTIPQPGEPNHEVWHDEEWVDRTGANSWGFTTVDVERGMIFVPIGTPNVDFYG